MAPEQLFRQFPFAKKNQTQTVNTEKLYITLAYQKAVHKIDTRKAGHLRFWAISIFVPGNHTFKFALLNRLVLFSKQNVLTVVSNVISKLGKMNLLLGNNFSLLKD